MQWLRDIQNDNGAKTPPRLQPRWMKSVSIYQHGRTVEICTQGNLARYDCIREPMDLRMGKQYILWILARLYSKTINQTLQKLKYLDNETKVELKQ